jgi:excisionase family DNA binding protein
MTDSDPFLLSIDEVASRLGVDKQAVRDWLMSNVLRTSTMGDGRRGVDAESVEALATALALPAGNERTDAMFSLRERNSSSQNNPTV